MDEDKFDMLLDRLDKLIFWLRFANLEAAKEYFAKVLDTARKREIYQLTDGKRSIAEINKAISVKSNRMVPDLWTDWTAKGILIESPKVKGRKAKVIDLKELGL
jgi:hypothetical protein